MALDLLYAEALGNMASALASFENRVPHPQRVPYKDGFVFRYVERTIEQAIVQKLARLASGLHAARILLDHGFFQEQAALQRMLDEFREDVIFLSLAVLRDDLTDVQSGGRARAQGTELHRRTAQIGRAGSIDRPQSEAPAPTVATELRVRADRGLALARRGRSTCALAGREHGPERQRL